MHSHHYQYLLASIFLGLGSFACFWPGVVETICIRPEFRVDTDLSRLFIACFGAQAILCGTVILTSRFTPMTFLVFGLIGSVPFFVFNAWFYFVTEIFTEWMLLDFAGNFGILLCGLMGYRRSREENQHARHAGLA